MYDAQRSDKQKKKIRSVLGLMTRFLCLLVTFESSISKLRMSEKKDNEINELFCNGPSQNLGPALYTRQMFCLLLCSLGNHRHVHGGFYVLRRLVADQHRSVVRQVFMGQPFGVFQMFNCFRSSDVLWTATSHGRVHRRSIQMANWRIDRCLGNAIVSPTR